MQSAKKDSFFKTSKGTKHVSKKKTIPVEEEEKKINTDTFILRDIDMVKLDQDYDLIPEINRIQKSKKSDVDQLTTTLEDLGINSNTQYSGDNKKFAPPLRTIVHGNSEVKIYGSMVNAASNKTYPVQTDIPCFWCKEKFSWIPIGCPRKYHASEYHHDIQSRYDEKTFQTGINFLTTKQVKYMFEKSANGKCKPNGRCPTGGRCAEGTCPSLAKRKFEIISSADRGCVDRVGEDRGGADRGCAVEMKTEEKVKCEDEKKSSDKTERKSTGKTVADKNKKQLMKLKTIKLLTNTEFKTYTATDDNKQKIIIKDYFDCEDNYCSFNCMVADYTEKSLVYSNQYREVGALTLMLYKRIFGSLPKIADKNGQITYRIMPAPHWKLMKKWGGNRFDTIEDFRESFQTVKITDIKQYDTKVSLLKPVTGSGTGEGGMEIDFSDSGNCKDPRLLMKPVSHLYEEIVFKRKTNN